MNHDSEYKQNAERKIRDLESRGTDAYPHKFDRTHTVEEVRNEFDETATNEASDSRVAVAGQVVAIRVHGEIVFIDLEDQSGPIQVSVRRDINSDAHRLATGYLSPGDHVGVEGSVFRTRRGELTIQAASLAILSHNLHPAPDKRHGIQNVAAARDSRYVELKFDRPARERFFTRSGIVWETRKFLDERGFVEVETPILDTVYGGAEARPFRTHLNALGQGLTMRISPELDLKRLLVGGMERVFEIGKQFRNEGMDASHHPEFTSLEVYEAFADYYDMMKLTEDLFSHLAREVVGSTRIGLNRPDGGVVVDLQPPFERMTYFGAIRKFTGADLERACAEEARVAADNLGVAWWDDQSKDEIARDIFDALVEDHLVRPTFIMDYPASICPLTKRHRVHGHLAERFELFIGGIEFANAYSELNDPREQRVHFERQERNRRVRGDQLAHPADWDFVRALEFGMPPAGGLGIGIDRLVMLLTGSQHIQDVILFPLRRS